jgi:hypothetical protein
MICHSADFHIRRKSELEQQRYRYGAMNCGEILID